MAIKILHSSATANDAVLQRFMQGSRKMAQLAHPNIVKVYRTVFEDDGYYAYIMEHIAGGDLGCACAPDSQLNLDETDLIRIFVELCKALQFAHDNHCIHRDIKPSNILLDLYRVPYLTDFDLVKVNDSTRYTATNARMGTIAYCAPEVAESAHDANVASDIYSLGLTLLSCLNGSDPPFPIHSDRGARWLSRLTCSQRLRDLSERAISSDPSRRPPSASEFQRELIGCLSTENEHTLWKAASSFNQPVANTHAPPHYSAELAPPSGPHQIPNKELSGTLYLAVFSILVILSSITLVTTIECPESAAIVDTTEGNDEAKRVDDIPKDSASPDQKILVQPPIPRKLRVATTEEKQEYINNTFGEIRRCAIENRVPDQDIVVALEIEARTGRVKPTIITDVGVEKFTKCTTSALSKRRFTKNRKIVNYTATYRLEPQ